MTAKISLEQWRALIAVVDAGGYAQAAERMHKTQSTVTYAVQKLQSILDVKAFEVQGRKAVLTPAGQVLYRRARALVEEAERLEQTAEGLAAGIEPELRVAADIIFPTWMLLKVFGRFAAEYPQTRIDLLESSLGGTEEVLQQGLADVIITPHVPPGFLGNPLMHLRFIAIAHPDHPLHRLGRPITQQDLRAHRQIVIRDSGSKRRVNAGWLGTEQRWTVTNKATAIRAVCMGLGFAWYPDEMIRDELVSGEVKALPLREGAVRHAELYLVFADPDSTGPGARRLGAILQEEVASQCREFLDEIARMASTGALPEWIAAGTDGSRPLGGRRPLPAHSDAAQSFEDSPSADAAPEPQPS